MRRAMWTMNVTLLATLLGGCSSSPEMQVVDDAASALGGRGDVEDVDTLVLEGEGDAFWLGEGRSPYPGPDDLPAFTGTFKREFDWLNGRFRFAETRTPIYKTTTGTATPQRYTTALDDDLPFNIDSFDKASPISQAFLPERRALLRHHPLGIVQAALAEGAQVVNPRQAEGLEAVDIVTVDGAELTLLADRDTGLPAKVQSLSYDYNRGDVIVETEFADYQDVDGLMLPMTLTTRIDGWVVAAMQVTTTVLNGETGRLEAPRLIRGVPTTGAGQLSATVEEIADGVWWVSPGRDTYSLVVEFEDHLTLINAPFGDGNTRAVIAAARQLRPDKPLTQAILTHHHVDYAGGVRAAVAEGLTLVVHESSREYYEDIVGRTHGINPDALATSPQALQIETVGEEMTLEDATRRLELYHVAGSEWVDGLLMAYLPAERLLYEADVFSPPADPLTRRYPEYPYAANLVDNIEARGLEIERVVPAHGQVVPFADLLKAAEPPFVVPGAEPEEPPA